MVAIPLGFSAYRRRGARTPEVALLNMMVEKDTTNQVDGLVRFQRPGLRPFVKVGTGPIRGVFRHFGVLSAAYLVVSGAALWTVAATTGVATQLGAVTGAEIVSMDGNATRAIVVAGGDAYSTDGSSFTQVNMPNGVPVSSVVYINGYFILTQANSQIFYWLAPGDVDPDALNFASSENAPGNIIKAARLLDEVWFFSEQATQVFQLSGDLDAPFTPIGGRLYEKGCANRDSIAILDNTLFWIGNDLMAYRADTTPIRISDHSMEERLRNAGGGDLRAWAMQIDGHTVYIIRAGIVGTFAFDVEYAQWGRWKSYGSPNWRAHVGTQIEGTTIVAGDDTSSDLWILDPTLSDENGATLERELTGGIAVVGPPAKCSSFSIRAAVGWSPSPSFEPKLQMAWSDDGGETWSAWREKSLGVQGQYRAEMVWRRLGHMRDPGRIFKVRMTDDAIFRISYARANDAVSA